ncbi:hypothetical protein FA13DRAFT_1717143 [Coprinellus micaceus]|uniref:Uncharacterized protein n=1 Tax=Coprinellus micaceus TaxID=71717 RepID=A0A4Y7SHP1_COPMI|nr:hypothetical protein FA13DRAFT_1717143 [Coprinellus micaceus]
MPAVSLLRAAPFGREVDSVRGRAPDPWARYSNFRLAEHTECGSHHLKHTPWCIPSGEPTPYHTAWNRFPYTFPAPLPSLAVSGDHPDMPDIDAGAAKDDITDADLALVLTDGATYQDVLVTAQSCARKGDVSDVEVTRDGRPGCRRGKVEISEGGGGDEHGIWDGERSEGSLPRRNRHEVRMFASLGGNPLLGTQMNRARRRYPHVVKDAFIDFVMIKSANVCRALDPTYKGDVGLGNS